MRPFIGRNRGETSVSKIEDRPLTWQHLLEALPDGTAVLDEHGVVQEVNTLLTSFTGYSREQLAGQNVQMFVPARHRGAERMARREHARDPNTRLMWSDQDLTVLCSDGREVSAMETAPVLVGP